MQLRKAEEGHETAVSPELDLKFGASGLDTSDMLQEIQNLPGTHIFVMNKLLYRTSSTHGLKQGYKVN